jgi:hypothetical protein
METISNEELIQECLKWYPVGTKFYPAHLPNRDKYCIVVNNKLSISGSGDCRDIAALTTDNEKWDHLKRETHGEEGNCYNRIVYFRGKWAEIILEPVEKKTSSDPLFDNSEEDDSKLSHDELLAKARRNYPIGTICKCLVNKNEEKIVSELRWFAGSRIIQRESFETRVYKNDGGKHQWAEIIFRPEAEPEPMLQEESKLPLIVGQWYKHAGWSSLKDFIKCRDANLEDSSTGLLIKGSEHITNGKYTDGHTSWNTDFNGKSIKHLQKATLEEIQEFLPNGHKDKFPKAMKTENLEGRYILCLDGQAKKHYPCNRGDYLKFVCSKPNSNETFTYEYWGAYDFSGKQNGNSDDPRYHGINVHSNPHFKLMPVGFVPDDNPKIPQPKYLIGDFVEVVSGGWQYSEANIDSPKALSHVSSGRQKGKHGYITAIKYSYCNGTYFYKIGSYGNMFTESALIDLNHAYRGEPVFAEDVISERIEHIKNASMPELKSNSKPNILDSSVEDTNIQLAPLRSKSKRIIF